MIDKHSFKNKMKTICVDSLTALERMFDINNNRFVFTSRLDNITNSLENIGISDRYTMITCLGLTEYEKLGNKVAFDIDAILFSLIEQSNKLKGIGDFGLLIWLVSLRKPELLPDLLKMVPLERTCDKFSDFSHLDTMALSWYLTGLCYALLSLEQDKFSLYKTASSVCDKLLLNYKDKGIFGHSGRRGRFNARKHLGSFADQIYPTYALPAFYLVTGNSYYLDIALNVTRTICGHQGSLGQWWWHYNAKTGNVANHYPVYSVHQDGMAPLALLHLSNVSNKCFLKPVVDGFGWLYNNELKLNMHKIDNHIILRGISPSRSVIYLSYLKNIFLNNSPSTFNPFTISECRPYHIGWLLYGYSKLAKMVE